MNNNTWLIMHCTYLIMSCIYVNFERFINALVFGIASVFCLVMFIKVGV